MVVLCWSLFLYALFCVHNNFAIILRKRELVAFLQLSFVCFVTLNVLYLFLRVPWVGLQCVIVVFSIHTYFLITYFGIKKIKGNVINTVKGMFARLKLSAISTFILPILCSN